jgi:preprotein translocase subunit SecB
MKPSSLKIDSYVFKKIYLEAFDAAEPENWQVESTVEFSRRKDNAKHWLVELTVRLKGDKHKAAYAGEFSVAGRFHVVDDLSEDASANLVKVNGPSILYSAVRELVLQLTSRGPYRSVLLPCVSFIDHLENAKKSVQPLKTAREEKMPDQAKIT